MPDPRPSAGLVRVISGGQTGVDRAALDAALACGLPHGGWCPRGRLAEDGPIPPRYQLEETQSPDYAVRTECNVVDSDGTLILHRGPLSGGTELTRRFALRHGKPLLLVDLGEPSDPSLAAEWLGQERIAVLNVAGPRESSAPGIGGQAEQFLRQLLRRLRT